MFDRQTDRQTDRNREIDLLRFIFATLIMLAHFNDSFSTGIFPRGHIGVEFFFIVSGFFMARSAYERNSEKDVVLSTKKFLLNKVSAFYPYYIGAMLLQLVVRYMIIQRYSAHKIIELLAKSIPNFSLVFMGMAVRSDIYVSGNWYLSVMILTMLLLYPLIVRLNRVATSIILPLLAVFLVGYYMSTLGNYIVGFDKRIALINAGTMRGMIDTMCGAIIYEATIEFNKRIFSKFGRGLLTTIKIICYGAAFYYAMGKTGADFSVHAFLYLIVAIFLSFSNSTYKVNFKYTEFLGKVSLPLYLFHGIVRFSVEDIFGNNIGKTNVLWLMMTSYMLAISMMFIVPRVDKAVRALTMSLILDNNK